MKKFSLTVQLILALLIVNSQPGMWTWMKGSNVINSVGSYGTLGVASANNEPPSRYAPALWTDTTGNFWIYGGAGAGGSVISDMWRFNPTTQMWTWMNGSQFASASPSFGAIGVFNATNTPGGLGYGVTAWVDRNNHFWIYGGAGSIGTGSDFWQYDPALNQWAWMGGGMGTSGTPPVYGIQGVSSPTNNPGARYDMTTAWVDMADNLWFFGGLSSNGSDCYGDMWKYEKSSGNWVWMSGSNTVNAAGNYGPIGTASVSYYPASRSSNYFWQDATGNFWLIGGESFFLNSYYIDVWKFNPNTLEWTLVKGSSTPSTSNITSANCTEDPANQEGGRYENRATWKVCDNLILNYSGYDLGWGSGLQNDMWAYVPSINDWVRVAQGTSLGSYGTQGVPLATNFPPERMGPAGFLDKNNNLWMFGGMATNTPNNYNDLWKYVIDTTCIAGFSCAVPVQPLQANANAIPSACGAACTGIASVTVQYGTPPYQYFWQPTNDTISSIDSLCAGTYFVTVTDAAGVSITDSMVVTSLPGPVVNLGNDTSVCLPDTLTFNAATAGASYLWGNGSTASVISAFHTGEYYVTVTVGGCTSADSIHLTENPKPPSSVSANPNSFCLGDSTLICANAGMVGYLWNTGQTTSCITTQLAGNYYITVTDANGCTAGSNQVAITVYPLPPVSISVNADTLSSYTAVTYQWFLNGNPIAGATSLTYITTQGGSYTVEITDSNGCAAFSSAVIISGIENLNEDRVEIYPNPSEAGLWNLEVGSSLIGAKVELFDDNGRGVFEYQISSIKTEIQLDIARGIYLMRIISEKNNITQKLIRL